ncbi:hypothetical protein BDW02DRAFT_398807 [Decorospora gaudefroyi]|uniref:Uncharacterized protein n=1 Tax=Decorospora gaudefroyi TaxID=184978 RepID=A0A6A5KAV9_9PLEO|nr:hypothetical protein BDW02DRAFT_398807 [Decorospora gaudefroyi]
MWTRLTCSSILPSSLATFYYPRLASVSSEFVGIWPDVICTCPTLHRCFGHSASSARECQLDNEMQASALAHFDASACMARPNESRSACGDGKGCCLTLSLPWARGASHTLFSCVVSLRCISASH